MKTKLLTILGIGLLLAGCSGKNEPAAPVAKPGAGSLPKLVAPAEPTTPAVVATPEAAPPSAVATAPVTAVPQGGIVPGSANDPNVMPAGFVPAATPRQYVVNGNVDLGALTEALRDYCMWKKTVPSDLKDLVTSKYLPNLPEPPAGKKYAINAGNLEVTLVNK